MRSRTRGEIQDLRVVEQLFLHLPFFQLTLFKLRRQLQDIFIVVFDVQHQGNGTGFGQNNKLID